MRIIIVITRMVATRGRGDDEFVQDWGQKQNQDSACWNFGQDNLLYVYHGCWDRFGPTWNEADSLLSDPNRVQDVCNRIKQHIMRDIRNLNAHEVGILVHPPINTGNVLIQAFKGRCLGIQPKFVVGLGHKGTDEVNNKVREMANAVRNENFNETVFDNWWNFFCKASSTAAEDPKKRLSVLKHRLAHLFLPIDIDLQGLMETNFKQEYWEEVVEAWKDGKAVATLTRARELLYGFPDNQDTVQKVARDAIVGVLSEALRKAQLPNPDNLTSLVQQALVCNDVSETARKILSSASNEIVNEACKRIQDIVAKWKQACELLPQSANPPNPKVVQILQDLSCQDKRKEVQQKCHNRTNPFHQWFAALDEALDKLREALQE